MPERGKLPKLAGLRAIAKGNPEKIQGRMEKIYSWLYVGSVLRLSWRLLIVG